MSVSSVLLLDDEQNQLDLMVHLLNARVPAHYVTTRYPTEAIQLATEHCFDVVLMDVTLDYNGTQFGGIEVYKELSKRYGAASLLAYSKYITNDLLKRYSFSFNFIEQDGNALGWIERLAERFQELRSRQSCFVAMPFSVEYLELYKVIKTCVEQAGYRCVRVDELVFTRSILDQILSEIRKAKLVLVVATSQNPNVFYEAGYAVALGKEVISITDRLDHLPFDVRDRNAVSYGSSPETLAECLTTKLRSITLINGL